LPKAAGLAEAIKNQCHIEPRLIEGRGGIFDVRVDGELIYSKHDTGEFPDPALIVERIRQSVA